MAGNDYLTQIVTRILIYGILVLSVELCWGQTGIFTFGQAALFGLGGYVVGLITTKSTLTDIGILLLIAIVVGAVTGLIIGIFLFSGKRVGELYVALVTLAISYICERLANSWTVLGSGNGIPGIPYPTIFGKEIGSATGLFFLAFVVFAIALILSIIIVNSQFGLTMNAVRDDEERAEFFGYQRSIVQIAVFVFAAALAASGGALFAVSEGFVSPSMSGLALSTTTVLWVVLGGRGTLFGPLIALTFLEAVNIKMQEALPSLWPILVGLLLLITMIFLPKGLTSMPAKIRESRRKTASS
ncbi:branched-chain amino acid ABC transporter permease [Actinomycetes bacterium]|nr:branched-chain amino acid ABC transporter permease [Actinomycetes bacterium]